MPYGTHKGVVLTVAGSRLFVFLAVDFNLDAGHGFEAVGCGHHVGYESHALGGRIVVEHVGDDVGKVVDGDEFLLVAEFVDALGHLAHGCVVEIDAQELQVLLDVGLARHLAEGIFARAAETFGQECVEVELVLLVAVGVDTGRLGEDILAHNRGIGGACDTGIAFDHARQRVDALFAYLEVGLHQVVEHGHHRREGGIAGTFAQSVDRDVHSACSGFDGSRHIRHSQVVVVVGMEVEMELGPELHHLTDEEARGLGVEDAQRVGQQEPVDGQIHEMVNHAPHIVRRVLHAVAPVLEIEVDIESLLNGHVNIVADVFPMFLRRLVELVLTMAQAALGEEVDDRSSGLFDPSDGGAVVNESENLDSGEVTGFTRPARHFRDALEFALGNPGGSHLDAIDSHLLDEFAGYGELLRRGECHTGGLFAVAKGCIKYFYGHNQERRCS